MEIDLIVAERGKVGDPVAVEIRGQDASSVADSFQLRYNSKRAGTLS
jgi:hypothetical protein